MKKKPTVVLDFKGQNPVISTKTESSKKGNQKTIKLPKWCKQIDCSKVAEGIIIIRE